MSGFIINPSRFTVISEGFVPLGNIVPSCVFDLAADQHDGSQTYANQEPTPADGTSQTNSDLWLGVDGDASTDDPTFDVDKFTFDGGDFFTFKSGGGGTLAGLHRTDIAHPATYVVHLKTETSRADARYLSTFDVGGNPQGMRIRANANGSLTFRQRGPLNSGASTAILNSGAIPDNTEIVLFVGLNSSSPGSEMVALNSDTGSAWAFAYAPDTTDADTSTAMNIGSVGTIVPFPAGIEFYNAALFNEILSDVNIALVRAELLARRVP